MRPVQAFEKHCPGNRVPLTARWRISPRAMAGSAHPLLPEREAAQRRPRMLATAIGAAAACALAFAGLVTLGWEEGGNQGGSRSPSTLLSAARQQQLAYDGPYDTPPVTWYFPGSSNQNTLGYTWNNAQMQTPTVTYGPGVPTNNGMAYTTADTIGYDFGDTTTAHPMGGNAVYQHETTYANQPGQPPDDTMYQYTGYQTSAARRGRGVGLKQRGARAQSLVELGSLDRELADEDPSGVVGRLASKLRDVNGDAKNLERKIALEGAAIDALGLRHKAARATEASQLQDKIAREEEELVAMRRHPRISRGRAHQKARRVMKTQAISAGGDQDLLGPVQWPGVDYADHASETSKLQPLPQQPAASPLAGTPLDLSDSKQAVTYCTQRVCNNMFVFGNVNLGTGETYETRPEVLGALGPAWDYAGLSTGPGNWSDLEPEWGICEHGRQQSPINIELSIRPDRYLKMLRWSGPSNPYEATLVGPVYANTFTLTDLKGHVTVSGLKMKLANMTIHTPSEHKVAGKHHHGELQFWHKAEVGDDHVTMIISAFLVLADTTAPFLKTTVETARGFAYTYNADALNGQGYDNPIYRGDVKPSLWFSTSELAEGVLGWGANYANYVTYAGSLSQPPCTEGVTRIVVRKPVPIKAGDLAAIAALQGQTNRPTQALNGRGVYEAMSHPPGQ